ncbi:MAG: adenylate/guanylate cyclase domain-containing protein [Deltaproteobacteria bacterium]|nr:adenylate/guanylate cyclase domain-containing protein [Deltaproteobacteria bacterium]
MTKFNLFWLKNRMLFANLIANVIGVSVISFLTLQESAFPLSPEIMRVGQRIDMIFQPCAFMVGVILTICIERPIRRHLNISYRQESTPPEIAIKARQRLLNEPFFLIALDLGLWISASVLYPTIYSAFGAAKFVIHRTFFTSLHTGLITTVIAFFVLEHVLQKRMVPHFFPDGGLYMTPKTLRIRISTRLAALIFACNLVPFISFLSILRGTSRSMQDPVRVLEQLRTVILTDSLLFMGVGIWLTILVSGNLKRPLHEIIRVLQEIRHGRFDKKVRVTSNDEIGYTGDVINEMTEGLKERDFVKETFGKYVTEEIRDEILSGKVSLDGELKEVTVLFADLRNFTPMVESTPPKEVVRIINSYFKEMDEAIKQYHGLVLQYIGDEIEAVFGAPLYRKDHPVMAVQAALEMRKRLLAVNQDLEQSGYPPLAHGIGIHTGEVLAANIGSPDSLSYALVGDTVNLASRLQGLNKEFGTEIIMSASTRTRLNGNFPLKELPATRVKGKSEPVEIFTLE